METSRSRRADGARSRGRIRGAAIALFTVGGYDGTSLAAITEAAGTQPSQVAYHFGSKRHLFVEAACRAALEVAQRVEEAGAAADTPYAYARAIVEAAAGADELRLFAEALLMAVREEDLRQRVAATLHALHEQGEAAVMATLQDRGWSATTSPRVEAEAFWSLMLGIALEHGVTPDRRLTESAARLILLIHEV